MENIDNKKEIIDTSDLTRLFSNLIDSINSINIILEHNTLLNIKQLPDNDERNYILKGYYSNKNTITDLNKFLDQQRPKILKEFISRYQKINKLINYNLIDLEKKIKKLQ